MLLLRSLRTPTRIDTEDLKTALLRLAEAGWKPIVLESQRTLAALAGVPDALIPQLRTMVNTPARGFGDLLFARDCVYYIRSSPTDTPFLEVGVVREDAAAECLDELARQVERAIMSALDGRKTRHMRFDWAEVRRSSTSLDQLVATEREETGTEFQRAILNQEELAGSAALEDRASRSTLVDISQAGFAREADILSRRGKAKEEAKAALDQLRSAGLLAVEYLIECRKANTPVARIHSADHLRDPAIASLKCATCGRSLADEVHSEVYSVSELGRRLLRKSHWMTVGVTRRLAEAGVPPEAVLWNVSDAGDEVDLVADVLGDLWVFELKDREFGAGDAYPFNYRRARYNAAKAIVVTTDRVSSDAKRVFEELAKEGGRTRPTPTYVEGIENTEPVLRQEIQAAYRRHATRTLLAAANASGYDLRPLLKARLGDLPDSREQGPASEWLHFIGRFRA